MYFYTLLRIFIHGGTLIFDRAALPEGARSAPEEGKALARAERGARELRCRGNQLASRVGQGPRGEPRRSPLPLGKNGTRRESRGAGARRARPQAARS